MAGRKSLKDELRMFERYSELSVPYFRVLRANLESEDKHSQQWAVEQLTKAFVKMIPTELTGPNGKDLFPVPILSPMNVQPHHSNQANSSPTEAN